MSKTYRTKTPPLPGSKHLRRRAARVLHCKKTSDEIWEVTGGRETHTITNLKCDCRVAQEENRMCSHLYRVVLAISAGVEEG